MKHLRKMGALILNYTSIIIIFILKLLPLTLQKNILHNYKLIVKLDYHKPISMVVLNKPTYHRKFSCQKEPTTVKWIEKYLNDNEVFYDIGANVGAYSLLAASIKKNVKVFSFEPSFSTFYALCLNIYENKLSDQIIPFSIALSDKNQIGDFNYVSIYKNMSGIEPGLAFHFAEKDIYGVSEKYKVDLTLKQIFMRLDNFTIDNNYPIPNMIKIDVDGIEFEILSNAKNILNNESCKFIIMEIPNAENIEINETISYLNQFGFKILDRDHRNNPYINVLLAKQ